MKQPYVLVIDDEAASADLAAYFLKRAGYEVCVSYSPVRGLDLAFDSMPEAIVCDLKMPGMSGLEVLRWLKANPVTARIPVVLTSGQNSFECAGAFTFLPKPFDSVSLVGAIQNALASVQSHDPYDLLVA